jgi:hypothetical protein
VVISVKHLQDAVAPGLAIYKRFQHHVAAGSMVVGFGIDNYTFGRIDKPGANIVLSAYLLVAAFSIIFAHFLETRADRIQARAEKTALRSAAINRPLSPLAAKRTRGGRAESIPEPVKTTAGAAAATMDMAFPTEEAKPQAKDPTSSRLRTLLPAATQFALGSLWSGFLVFYSRSAALAASWPFMLLLLAFFIGNETFKKYHSRLVFSSLLLFFALYSYSILVAPVFTGSIGKFTFILSGVLAVMLFLVFLRLLQGIGPERYRQSRPQLFLGMGLIFAAINAFYFFDVLPPLPLALFNVGVYDSVKHVGDTYQTVGEQQSTYATLGLEPQVIHVAPKKPLYVYSAVFAPIKLHTRITHRWQWYDDTRKKWLTQSNVSFAINGGREGGYRAYSVKTNPKLGDWRVDICSDDNRLIGRIRFDAVAATGAVATVAKTLQ